MMALRGRVKMHRTITFSHVGIREVRADIRLRKEATAARKKVVVKDAEEYSRENYIDCGAILLPGESSVEAGESDSRNDR